MAGSNTSQIVADNTGPKGNLGDYQHASRVFVDGNMRLSPKSKFNFHVVLSINPAAIALPFSDANKNEVNMLVKSVDLPKFKITTHVANQYNRKKIIQSKHEYEPINIIFHDDNEGIVRKMWENYYSHYYSDYKASKKPEANFPRNAMKGFDYIKTAYGLDGGNAIPFFTKITIYHMAQQKWNSYTLINPIIASWSHDKLDYANSNSLCEHNIQFHFEAVNYDSGTVEADNPPGFGMEHYDTTPSSLTLGTSSGVLWKAINNSITKQ